MREKEMKELMRDCLREYHEEDKKILIDASVLQLTCITFFIKNLKFFGNKIYFFRETLDEIIKISRQKVESIKDKIRVSNACNLLEEIEKDKYGNYQIIESKKDILKYLDENSNAIFYLADYYLFEELEKYSLCNQLVLLSLGMEEVNPFRNRNFKFDTIGPIKFENGRMRINYKEGSFVKAYNFKGIEKNAYERELKPKDFVLIRSEKEDIYSFLLYVIVSRHTRNHALKIIWTDLKKGHRTNKYIERLPYQYRRIILDNIE